MTFRARLLTAFLLTVLLPLIALALFIRHETTDRLTTQYERRVESLMTVIEDDLSRENAEIAASLNKIQRAVVDDNRFRRATVDQAQDERRYLLDYAASAMQLTGLSMLQLQDEAGRIISSGHFRNEFDRLEPALPILLATNVEAGALIEARAPDASFVALARVDSFQMANRRFTIVAGVKVEQRFLAGLAREQELTVSLIYPGGTLTSEGDGLGPDPVDSVEKAIVRELSVPFIDSERGEIDRAVFRVSHRLDELNALRGSIDRWFLFALIATGLLATLIATWLASRISRPLVKLADKTSRIDLDRLDIDFDTHRKDEVGTLSRLLGAMTDRLRASTLLIKDAERRATRGELARQVNHDIKNGLTPIRNVFRHLAQLAASEPRELPNVFQERRNTLDSSISYLENLASNYARLYPHSERGPCDVNEIVRRVATDLRGAGKADLETNLNDKAVVLGDPLSLRRVLENLVGNAVDSLESRPGRVVISTARINDESAEPRIRIVVQDTGRGMDEAQRAKIFDDFYTTKSEGTGLGLSIVRRLVMDLDGTIRVESEEGKGSRFVIDLPMAGAA